MRTEYNNKVVSGVGIVILLLVMWALLTINIGDPWLEHHYGNTTWISAAARNYRLYGAAKLGYMVVINRGPASPSEFDYYPDHPPMIVWSIALAGIPFGQYEAVARWLSASFTLVSIAALYTASRRLFDGKRALLVASLYGLTPMVAYYGRMPSHEVIMLCFTLVVNHTGT